MEYVENGNARWQFICDDKKPNIFLIGDSIRQGYCKTVKKELSDIASVFYCDDNCRSTQYVIFSLRYWANSFSNREKVDIVQFNCGHWDVAHWNGYEHPLTSEDEYAKNIKMIIVLLKELFPNAKIVFATTTFMNPDGSVGVNPRYNDDIEKYNKIAEKIAIENGTVIFDLNKITRDWGSEKYADYCHFTESAFAVLGKKIANELRELI